MSENPTPTPVPSTPKSRSGSLENHLQGVIPSVKYFKDNGIDVKSSAVPDAKAWAEAFAKVKVTSADDLNRTKVQLVVQRVVTGMVKEHINDGSFEEKDITNLRRKATRLIPAITDQLVAS